MRSPGRPLVCVLTVVSLLALSAAPSVAWARAHHHRHHAAQRHRSGTLSPSAPSSVRHHRRHHHRTLPFTGFNLWAYALVGVGMLGTGLLLRRLTVARR